MTLAKRFFVFQIVVVTFSLLPYHQLYSATIRVPADQPTIQAGIDAAGKGDTVLVADGVYKGSGNINIGIYNDPVLVLSENGPEATIIDCEGNDRAISIAMDSLAFEVNGFTLRNGVALGADLNGVGGSIRVYGGLVELRNCIFENNAAHKGGALYLGGRVLIESCEFTGNSATEIGGAAYCIGDSVKFDHSVFSGNSAPSGGAVTVGPRQSTNGMYSAFYNCTFVGNHADTIGAGLLHQEPQSTLISRCLFAFNTGSAGVESNYPGPGLFFQLQCTNVFGNEGGDWVGKIEHMADTLDNFSLDPELCSTGFYVSGSSPCASYNSPCGELVGARSILCNCCQGLRGDLNLDGDDANVLDFTLMVDHIFRNGPAPICAEEADINVDGVAANLLDLTLLIDYIFRNGIGPPACP